MNKKQVLTLLIVTNLISITVVTLFFALNQSRQKNGITAQQSNREHNLTEKIQERPTQAKPADISSAIAQYDTVKSGRYQQVMEAYGKAIRMEPPYTAESSPQARYYANQGYYDKAIEVGEEDIQDTHWPDNFYALAWVYTKVGRYDKAMEVCEKATKLHPDYSKIWHISGWIHAKNGEYDKAINDCNQVLKLDPLSAPTYYALGRIYGVLGRKTEAVNAYKKAVQLKSDWPEAHLSLGLTYAELGNKEEAIKSYQEAIHFDKYYPEPYVFLGMAYDESGRYDKAIESFEQAIIEYYMPGNVARIHSLGVKLDLANIYCAIGLCHLRLSQQYEASVAFKKAIEIESSNADAHYGLALADLLLGDKKSALMECETVKTLKGEQISKPLFDIIRKAE